MDKLAGLRLGTSERDLTPSSSTPGFSNPLSPESSDIAISSFSVFKGANPSALAAKPPQQPQSEPAAPPRKVVPQAPPQFITEQQGAGMMGSLNALSGPAPMFQSRDPPGPADEDDKDDGLFALPISPRSPEVGKSPFSFAVNETAPFLKEESAV